jgi:hypothetical protein
MRKREDKKEEKKQNTKKVRSLLTTEETIKEQIWYNSAF